DWTGATRQAERAADEFLGSFIASPGDRVTRTLTVRNNAPGDGRLTMEFLDAVAGSGVGESPIDLIWSAGDEAGSVPVEMVDSGLDYEAFDLVLPRGATVKLTLGWEFADSEEVVEAPAEMSVPVSFGVRLTLREDLDGSVGDGGKDGKADDEDLLAPLPSPPATPEPSPDPSTDQSSGPSPSPSRTEDGTGGGNTRAGQLPFTGTRAGLITWIAGSLAATGLILLVARRRRREEED
ncbi:MAG: hypothetical protein LBL01_05415, partial [Bifidobacteriaceae bacterium]|nr:hypothetical protein [Bifidobacteriaceae bacterium]